MSAEAGTPEGHAKNVRTALALADHTARTGEKTTGRYANVMRRGFDSLRALAAEAGTLPKYVSLDNAGPGFLRRNPDYQGEDIIESPAPRENGWEELRREIEALPDVNPTPTVDPEADVGWPMVKRAAVLAIVIRLAAARGEPPEPGLREAAVAIDNAWNIQKNAYDLERFEYRGGLNDFIDKLRALRVALRALPPVTEPADGPGETT